MYSYYAIKMFASAPVKIITYFPGETVARKTFPACHPALRLPLPSPLHPLPAWKPGAWASTRLPLSTSLRLEHLVLRALPHPKCKCINRAPLHKGLSPRSHILLSSPTLRIRIKEKGTTPFSYPLKQPGCKGGLSQPGLGRRPYLLA